MKLVHLRLLCFMHDMLQAACHALLHAAPMPGCSLAAGCLAVALDKLACLQTADCASAPGRRSSTASGRTRRAAQPRAPTPSLRACWAIACRRATAPRAPWPARLQATLVLRAGAARAPSASCSTAPDIRRPAGGRGLIGAWHRWASSLLLPRSSIPFYGKQRWRMPLLLQQALLSRDARACWCTVCTTMFGCTTWVFITKAFISIWNGIYVAHH